MPDQPAEIWGSPEIVLSAPELLEIGSVPNSSIISLPLPLSATLSQTDTERMSFAQVLSFRIPIKVLESQLLIGFQQVMTMAIVKTSGARVLVVADLAGSVKTIEFGFDIDGTLPISIPGKEEVFYSLQGKESAGQGLVGVLGPTPAYEATFTVTAQRRSPDDYAIFTLDSLDISAHIFDRAALQI